MSYRDELQNDYDHREFTEYRDKEQWINVIEKGDLTHADVMRLVAERDAVEAELSGKTGELEQCKMAMEQDFEDHKSMVVKLNNHIFHLEYILKGKFEKEVK